MNETPTPDFSVAFAPPTGIEAAPVWIAQAIDWAHRHGATDIHFFPSEQEARLWVRVDGDLAQVCVYSLDIHRRVIARLKVLGRCADYDGEAIQEGRFTMNGTSAGGEARLSIIPTLQGEKAVVRLLGGGDQALSFDELGFSPELMAELRRTLDAPQGLLLATGPSGCGKSTALYGLLRDLNQRSRRPVSIVTLEDPVEQTLSFAAQMTLDPTGGLGFAQALRGVLRQDPEVIMIGEIRDVETAEAALHAALTGHRILSSMHTLNPGEALIRFRQMGLSPYIINSALAGILNVRLVRLLCTECKRSVPITKENVAKVFGEDLAETLAAAEAPGCEVCLGTGARGRTALAEWLEPTATTAAGLEENASAPRLTESLTIVDDAREPALALLRSGRVAFDEIAAPAGLASFGASKRGRTER